MHAQARAPRCGLDPRASLPPHLSYALRALACRHVYSQGFQRTAAVVQQLAQRVKRLAAHPWPAHIQQPQREAACVGGAQKRADLRRRRQGQGGWAYVVRLGGHCECQLL